MGRREDEYEAFLERTGLEDSEIVLHDWLDETDPDGGSVKADYADEENYFDEADDDDDDDEDFDDDDDY